MILAVIVVLVIGVNPHWQKYKDEDLGLPGFSTAATSAKFTMC